MFDRFSKKLGAATERERERNKRERERETAAIPNSHSQSKICCVIVLFARRCNVSMKPELTGELMNNACDA